MPFIDRGTAIAAAFFGGAGVMHFARPDFFEAVVPDWFPNAKLANYASGAAEIALAAGLLVPSTRRRSALGLVALTAAVFPANIDMALNDVEITPVDGKITRSVGTATGPTKMFNMLRLPMQIPMAVGMWRIAQKT